MAESALRGRRFRSRQILKRWQFFFGEGLPTNACSTERRTRRKRDVDERHLVTRKRRHFAALRIRKTRVRIKHIGTCAESNVKLPFFRGECACRENRLEARRKNALPTLRQVVECVVDLCANRLPTRFTSAEPLHALQNRGIHA